MNKKQVEIQLEELKRMCDRMLEGQLLLLLEIREFGRSVAATLATQKALLQNIIDAPASNADAVAADLAAHRADTECHSRSYRVAE